MRRFVSLSVLLLFAIPFGVSISGCSKHIAPTFCNGGDSGVATGAVTTITLLPKVYGISLNYAEIGQIGSPSATDCKGNAASVGAYTYGTSDMTIADIQPTTGRLCGGTWNRNTGGGIPDFTVCNPTNKSGTAYVTASADGVSSNALPIFIHPVVTSVVLGTPTTNCTTDPTTNCCPLASQDAVVAAPFAENSCLSQGATAQLVARVFAGTGASTTNISCQAGHLQFSAQTSSIANIDQNGVITANQPGSTLITANVSNAASSAGFFSTCPPASIALSAPGAAGQSNPVVIDQNNNQPLLATVLDTQGKPLTGLSLEYVSTTPSTLGSATGGIVTPPYAGSGSITAVCQPPVCNPSSQSQIGLFGTGKPVTSNSVNFTTPGTNSTVLYMASTQSEYIVPIDFTTSSLGAPFLLPYFPNSMVISNDGSTIYMGSATALMVLNVTNSVSIARTDIASPGEVLALSPDGSTVVITDPVRQTISLETSSGAATTVYGGVGARAQFTPDSQTVYITTGTVTTPATATTPPVIAPGNQVLVHNQFTGWTQVTTPVAAADVAVTIPGVGAYFAGTTTSAIGYCPISVQTTTNGTASESNVFYPPADSAPVTIDRLTATLNGAHILGATAAPKATLTDLAVRIPSTNTTGAPISVACPAAGALTFANTPSTTVLSPINATAITGVLAANDSSVAFVTYTGTGGVLPAYVPTTGGPGQASYIKLSGTAIAPIAGVGSADNTVFYVGTSGDNLVHLINRSTLTDASTLAPKLVDGNGNPVPVNLLVQKPRKTT